MALPIKQMSSVKTVTVGDSGTTEMLIFSFLRLKVISMFWELFYMQGCSKVFLYNSTLGKTKADGRSSYKKATQRKILAGFLKHY